MARVPLGRYHVPCGWNGMHMESQRGSCEFDQESSTAGGELFADLYEHLHAQARNIMRRQPAGHTLQPTALVSEAYLRLSGRRGRQWVSRKHFLASASKTMLCVLVDHARKKQRQKRRTPGSRLPIEAALVHFEKQSVDVIDLQEKLKELERLDAKGRRAARIVELRAFGGLTMPEIAEYLGTPQRTIEREFRFARAWLHAQLALESEDPATSAEGRQGTGSA